MAGRYILTPARRAALKRAQAKSAAKRRGRGQYRQAKRGASRNLRAGQQKYFETGRGAKPTTLVARYDRSVNDAAVKYKGKKKRSNKYLKRKRQAKAVASVVAIGGAYAVAAHTVAKSVRQNDKRPGAQFANHAQAKAKATKKARKSYNRAVKKNNRADFRDARAAGIKGQPGTKRVKSTRGPAYSTQKALTGRKR